MAHAPENPRKILIIQTAFMGDAVLATAAAEKLHSHFPKAAITMLVRRGHGSLFFPYHPWLGVLEWDKKQKLKSWWWLLRHIRKQQFDVVVNVQRFFLTGLLTVLSGAKHTVGFDKNPLSRFFSRRVKHKIWPKATLHEVERNQQLIAHMTDEVPAAPRLYVDEVGLNSHLEDLLRQTPYATLSPATVWTTKQMPNELIDRVIAEMPEGVNLLLLGGPGDAPLCLQIKERHPDSPVLMFAGELSLLQSAKVMKGAVLNITNDSGPMHLASAVDAPVAAVYCSTVPEFGFGPLSTQRWVVQKQEELYCRPCGLHGYPACPEGHFRCGHEIDKGLLPALLTQQLALWKGNL